jgi:hypothetical protein
MADVDHTGRPDGDAMPSALRRRVISRTEWPPAT